MGAHDFKALGKPFKLFLMIDFLILVLSFIGTAQFANECYQLMSFAGLAAAFGWFFLSYIVLCLLFYLSCWESRFSEKTVALRSLLSLCKF